MRARSSMAALAALLLVLAAAAPALAEAPALDLAASGWLAASAYARPNAEEPFAAAGLRGGLALDGYAFDAVGLRLSLEAYTNLAGLAYAVDWSLARPDPLSLAATGNGRLMAALDLKEAWLEFSSGALDARLGKQVVAWGLADGNNPTDNVNARHVGTRFVSTLDEQKLGALAANLVYNLPGNLGTVQGLFLPVSVPNDMSSIAQTITAGPTTIVIEDDEAPGLAIVNFEGGLRALFYLGSVSASASWLSYLNRFPDYEVTVVGGPAPLITLSPFHGRVNQFGLDAAWLPGGFDLRTEWALSLTGDEDGTDLGLANSSLSGVVQASKSFFDSRLTASLAWAPRIVFDHHEASDYASPGDQMLAAELAKYNGQAYAFEQVGSLRLAGKLLGETLQPEALFLASLEARDFLATASVAYNVADGVNLKGGLGIYGSFREEGDPEREWGTFSNSRTIDNDYLYLELRLSL